jgi:high-affinity Fe2+/Pb2+ permease
MRRKTRRFGQEAQNIVEYIILLAVVIAILFAFFRPNGLFSQQYQRTIQTQGDDMVNAARRIF